MLVKVLILRPQLQSLVTTRLVLKLHLIRTQNLHLLVTLPQLTILAQRTPLHVLPVTTLSQLVLALLQISENRVELGRLDQPFRNIVDRINMTLVVIHE